MFAIRRSVKGWSAVLGLVAMAAQAAMVEPMSVEQMTAAATAVVRAEVGKASASRSGPLIFTDRPLRVIETIAGDGANLETVSLPGGVLDGIAQEFAGVPKLQAGEEYVLFLWRGPSGRVQVVGLAQGVFAVEKGDETRVSGAAGETAELDAFRSTVRGARQRVPQRRAAP